MAELVAGALLSSLLDVLAEKLAAEVVGFFKGKGDIVKLVKELKAQLYQAGLLLIDAEDKLIRDQRVKKWLDDLKETIYDADDLVYKIDTKALWNQLEGESQSGCTCKVLLKLISTTPLTAFDKAIKPEIEEILGKLKLLLGQNNNLALKLIEKQKLPERVRAPLVEESDVYGRDHDKETIIKLLLSDDTSGNKFDVIPIVGMGGIGKTTLAQLVYNDERANKRFDTKVWVTVGDDDKVDCLRVMKIIILKVTNSEKCEIEEQFELLDKLKNVLTGKKFLIVLDDVWDESPHRWDVLKNCFVTGSQGSKIVVTTRSKIVASIMETGSTYYLKGVSYDDGWRLFAKHALIDANSDDYSDLQVIGRKIVDKCKGLPLAIKSLGGLLHGKRNKEEWDNILNNDLWGLYERSRIGILPALWLSYYYLPSELKPCFAYCAIFPKDHEFKKEKMILLWMAEGLLHPKNGKRLEDVGEEYFQDLISRSFFQPSERMLELFMMHDLMHDLAIFVSGEFCLEMDGTKFSNYAHKIRHLSYRGGADGPEKFENLSTAKGLRTFLTFPKSRSDKSWSLNMEYLLELLPRTWGCLRVLSIADEYYISKIPHSIGDLKYLRYLEIDCFKIKEIPNSICNLYNLETLILEKCIQVNRLPSDIGNLINLRHLHVSCALEEMPLQIGKMKKLQTLNNFVVGGNSECGIKLLKELNLHRTLKISRLENVGSVEDVSEGELRNKKFLSELYLSWSFNCPEPDDLQKESEILGAFEPHANLKKLCIEHYSGSSFPNWIGSFSLSNVVNVRLQFWKKCSFLPPLGQLPSLKHLFIGGFDGVKTIGSEFYYPNADSRAVVRTTPFKSLESLRFIQMSELQEWSFIEGEVFPRLEQLILSDCRKLKVSLPYSLPSLRKLYIQNCFKLLPLLPTGAQQAIDNAFPSLENLKISFCDGQHSVLKGGLPLSLKMIEISYCPKLETLDEETFQHLTSLETLKIKSCENLRCLPTSLSNLFIEDCPLLVPQLKREAGDGWPIIAHFSNITIDSDD